MPDARYSIDTVSLKEEDCLIFYTDGLIDAVDFEGRLWTRDQMIQAAQKCVTCSADHIAKNILRYRRRFVGLSPQLDDTSMIVVKVGTLSGPAGYQKGRDI